MAEVMIPWDHYEAPYFLLAKPISRIACLQQSDGLNVLLWSRSFRPAVGSTWLPAAIGESDSLWVPERHPTSVSSAFYTYTTTWGKLKHAWLGFDTNNSPNCGMLSHIIQFWSYHYIIYIPFCFPRFLPWFWDSSGGRRLRPSHPNSRRL